MNAPHTIVFVSLASFAGAFGCSKSEAAPTASSAAPETPSAVAPATPAAPTAEEKAEAKTTERTTGDIKKNFSALMGKEVSGEAVMYHFESVTLNGQKQNNAYIADDENKTSSIQCMLKEPTKIKKNTKVTFKGKLRTINWIDDCEIEEKK